MVQVIGGGISGLLLAFYLKQKGHAVNIVESNTTGGILQTYQTPYGPVESAANAMLCNANIERVAQTIGLTLEPTLKHARKRFIYRNGKMSRWPLSITASARFFLVILKALFTRKFLKPLAHESIFDWAYRIFGFETTTYFIAPAMSGIYSGNVKTLSAPLILNKFFQARPPKGTVRGSVAPPEGMGEWSKKLKAWLLANGATFNAYEPNQKTILARPPPAAANFLKSHGLQPELAALLEQVPMNNLVSATLFFPSTAIQGFGCLFPREAGFRVLGVLSNSYVFKNRSQNSYSETWIFGGDTDQDITSLTKDQILQLVLSERKSIFQKSDAPLHHEIFIWPKAIPNYSKTLEQLQAQLQPYKHQLFGTYLGEIGLSSLFHRAEQLASEL